MLPGATIADRLITRMSMAPSVPKRTGAEQVDHPCGQNGEHVERGGARRERGRHEKTRKSRCDLRVPVALAPV